MKQRRGKQHIAVFMLFVRSSLYPVLVLSALMAAAEWQLFHFAWKALEQQYLDGESVMRTAEVIVDKAGMELVFLMTLGIMTILLVKTGRSMGSHQEYTLYRLGITPKSVCLWQALYNSCCFFLLWAVQAVVAFGLGLYFVQAADRSLVTNQSLFLAFYRNDFLHAVLPLERMMGWVRNVAWFLALGCSISYDSYCSRRGKHSVWLWALLVGGIASFSQGLGATGLGAAVVLYLVILAVMGYFTLVEGEWAFDEE